MTVTRPVFHAVHFTPARLLILLLGAGLFQPAPRAGEIARVGRVDLPSRDLRGFGRVSARFEVFAGSADAGGACLTIRCQDDARARLTAAKYARDLNALSGIARESGPEQAVWQIPHQGWVTVCRKGKRLAILAAESRAILATLAADLDWPVAEIDESLVPMWLDAWDRHGFRFYYRPWEAPKCTRWPDYPVLDEFDFAKRSGRAGFIFWAKPENIDTGPALTNRHWWDWAARAAARRDLPVVINTVRTCPTWLLNRYRDQVMRKMPQYCGSYHSIAEPHHDGMRQLSWCATTAADAEYAIVQQHVRGTTQWPNVLDYMEPNCELKHGEYDVFLEYGPVADASFRRFLRDRHGALRRVNRRWYGAEKRLRSWEDVRVPELASFLGWGPDALDLTGKWRIAYEPFAEDTAVDPNRLQGMHHDDIPTVPAPDAWYAADLDDSDWATVRAPGHDLMMFRQKRPAVFRRSFPVSAGWLEQGKRAWLYVWDLNYGKHNVSWVRAAVNGRDLGRDTLLHAKPHWAAFEVTGALTAGTNVVAVRVPKGVLAYRVYLSHSAPIQYPALGEQLNAQWVDFSDWRRQTRLGTCRRGLDMIRQIDPNRSIILAAPDGYATGVRQLCEQYGGRFHNTGHMGGFWNDFLPMLMRGADLPFSLEPGGPARDLAGFKKMMGLYFTEGIQAIHYFIHVGSIMWSDEIRQHFERIQPLLQTIGKVHPPKANVAMLLSNRTNSLAGYPWGRDYDVNLPTGYWGWRFSDALAADYHIDAVTELDFGKGGNADPYQVIIDTNTSVMDEATVEQVEGWVRRGGTFVTMIQTGRHTPERPDAWPISRLTGYRVTGIDPHRADGGEGRTRGFRPTGDQDIFAADDWPAGKNHYTNGLSLEKVDDDCRDLLLWDDGSVATGLRRLGKGRVLHVGVKFGTGRGGGSSNYQKLLTRVLEWAGIEKLPARAHGVVFRHYVSNNGLYDLWTLWNRDREKSATTRIVFRDTPPPTCRDLLTGVDIAPTTELTLAPLETRILLSPRRRIVQAPLDWVTLQRNWWRASKRPSGKPLQLPPTPNMLDLSDGWTCHVLDETTPDESVLALVHSQAKTTRDSRLTTSDQRESGTRHPTSDIRHPTSLACWAVGEELPSRRALFLRTFAVPEHWQDGHLTLWLRSWFSRTVIGAARFWLNGEPIPAGDGRAGLIHSLDLAPGSTHTLAVEIRGEGQVYGVRGNTWLAFTPSPRERLDLAGRWTPSRDFLRWGDPVDLPGALGGVKTVRRRFVLPEAWPNGQVYLHMTAGYAVTGAIVNGRYIRRHHHALGDTTFLNITPLLRHRAENEIMIMLGGGRQDRIENVHLRLYDKDAEL